MSLRAKVWARQARARLLEILGGKCAHCGTAEQLTFDCIIPTGHHHHGWSTDKRMTFYRRQHAEGNVQVLCHSCNASKKNDVADEVSDWLPTLDLQRQGRAAVAVTRGANEPW